MTATYIALEGPDGVGKSTVAIALKELLQRRAPLRPPDLLCAYGTSRPTC